MQAKLCGKLRFFTQGPECLSFSRLEAMPKKTANKLNVRRKSQWEFKNSAHLLSGCCGYPMKVFQEHSPLQQTDPVLSAHLVGGAQ